MDKKFKTSWSYDFNFITENRGSIFYRKLDPFYFEKKGVIWLSEMFNSFLSQEKALHTDLL